MKKNKNLYLVLLGILVLVSGCTGIGKNNSANLKTGELVAYEICSTTVDSIYGGYHSDEYSMWTHEDMEIHVDPKAPKGKTVEFDGIIYDGTYTYSRTGQYNNYQSDRYEINQRELVGWFTVISGTDRVDYISLPLEPPVAGDSAENRAWMDKAKEVASSIIDVNEYECSIESNIYYDIYRFKKEIDGVTCAALSVAFRKDGAVAVFDYIMVDEYNEIKMRHTEEEIKEAIKRMTSVNADSLINDKIKKYILMKT